MPDLDQRARAAAAHPPILIGAQAKSLRHQYNLISALPEYDAAKDGLVRAIQEWCLADLGSKRAELWPWAWFSDSPHLKGDPALVIGCDGPIRGWSDYYQGAFFLRTDQPGGELVEAVAHELHHLERGGATAFDSERGAMAYGQKVADRWNLPQREEPGASYIVMPDDACKTDFPDSRIQHGSILLRGSELFCNYGGPSSAKWRLRNCVCHAQPCEHTAHESTGTHVNPDGSRVHGWIG
jgi:hypothetical protein